MKTKSLAVMSVLLALAGALVLLAGTAIAEPSQQDSAPSETPFTPSSTPTVTPTPEPIRLSGLITLNGVVAPPSLSISVLNADKNVCGETITQQGGRYEILLGSNCPAGTTASLRLEAVPDAVGTPVTLTCPRKLVQSL